VRPVGSTQRIKVDVRVIAAPIATSKPLQERNFRRTSISRLNVLRCTFPPAASGAATSPMLCRWFLERYAPGSDLPVSAPR